MSEHKTNPVWKPHERVSKEYADSYQWWSDFLKARPKAIDAMTQLGKDHKEIVRVLNLNDENHVERLVKANDLNNEV